MSGPSPRARRLLQIAFGAVVVTGTIAVVGTGPLIRGVLAISPAAILLGAAFTAVATLAAVWRWRTVSAALGLPITWGAAVGAYYRSQFLNTVLPGGVVGDVHRAYRQGLSQGAVPLAARAVAAERLAGQIVQAAVTAVVLLVLGSTGALLLTAWIGVALVAVIAVAVAIAAATRSGRRFLLRELTHLRKVFRSPRATLSIVAASVVVVAAHSATFIVACLAVGVGATPRELVGLAAVAMAAAALPLSIGGCGPREAASASAFAVVGLGAGGGLAASTAFGVLTMIAVLPGLVVLIVEAAGARRSSPAIERSPA
jgi:uncharacterized membrane protein YbhN (UPF0104 family)